MFLVRFLCATFIVALGMGTAAARGSSSPGVARYLYVVDSGASAVYRYPLHDGLPAQAPDAALHGLDAPGHLVLDRHGHIYVDGADGRIREFALNARGFGPLVRSLGVVNYSGAFSADADGYVYAVVGSLNEQINEYGPFSDGSSPLRTLTLPQPGAPDLKLDRAGRLHSLANSRGIQVFSQPRVETMPDTFVQPIPPAEDVFFGSMGLSDLGVIVHFSPRVLNSRWQDGAFAFVERMTNAPARPDVVYYTRDCYLQGDSPGPIAGFAKNESDVFVSCQFPHAVVFVYDTRTARDGKLAYATYLGAPLVMPADIEVGR